MDYKIAICDDSKTDREYLIKYIEKWAEERNNKVELSSFPSSESFLFQYEEEKDYEIIFLDIEMGEMDGVTLAKKLRNNNQSIQIIFVTGYPDFMSEGYEVSALHYLMKPVLGEKIEDVLDKAAHNLDKTEKSIILNIGNEAVRVELKDITYIEVFAHSCILHTVQQPMEVKITISELEKMIGGTFIRTHRSYLVNINCIKRITKTEVVLDDGEKVPISRRNYMEVNQAFINYFRKDMMK